MTRTIHRLYNVNAQRILDREGVNIAHWYYLRVLAERGMLNQLELSKRVGIASTTAVTALDNLEKRGLVRRSRDTNDRRKYFVSITDEGQRLIDELMPDIEQMLVDSVQGIPAAEMRTFWAVLQRIADNLSKTAGNETVLD
ncbi:MarR family winged helix-turn-helix transcriptional regulator [Ralstonia pseudosolanacearum]|uniref:MarR family transcriptional regulator n=2 Tax=Ralstonia solanacearum species complex TaxID=3116862 RepID=A0ABX8A1D4_9RALS|nr:MULTISPECIES: MarR family transcriptional regulator [Ralstonia solanacearum species complex]MCK4124465.1 MarR family transcriptional regulator [Ralstonia pseudosolanacearum]QIK21319.1 MarR family transcriptional regulator [Ralstonia solanacearum]QUP61567.1 MarR family transcriptional regulator [Ralstonia nicotianae]